MTDRDDTRLIQSAMDLLTRLRPLRMTHRQPILMHIPTAPGLWVALVLTLPEQAPTVVLFFGPNAWGNAAAAVSENSPSDVARDTLTLNFRPLGGLPGEARSFVERNLPPPSPDSPAPLFVARAFQQAPRATTKEERRDMRWCLEGLLSASRGGELPPRMVDDPRAQLLELRIAGTPNEPTCEAAFVPHPEVREDPDLTFTPDRHLFRLPRNRETWYLADIEVPEEAQAPDRTPVVFAIGRRAKRSTRVELTMVNDALGLTQAASILSLIDCMQGMAPGSGLGRPARVVIADPELHERCRAGLVRLGCKVVCADLAQEQIESLTEQYIEARAAIERDELPQDLERWEDDNVFFADMHVTPNVLHATDDSVARYFGDAKVGRAALEHFPDLLPSSSFGEYLLADDAPNGVAPIEALLASNTLNRAETVLAEARREAILSVFRALPDEPDSPNTFECVFTGQRVVLDDCEAAPFEEIFLPLRVFNVPGQTLCVLAGTPIDHDQLKAFIDLLQRHGVAHSHEAFRANAHLFGQLHRIALPTLFAGLGHQFAARMA